VDRSRRRPRLLIALAAGACLAGAAAPPLRALRWVAPGADGARILTERPVECLPPANSASDRYLIEVGRAAFRTPLVLGGSAARSGIECETCHRNGRTNHDFHLPGLSGAPGTADVTSFLFSPKRGSGIFNPRPIPDLGGPKAALKVAQTPGSPALQHFIHGLVTEEFDGAEPPPAVMSGLAAYVRALSPSACPAAASERVTLGSDVDNARRAVRAGLSALANHDPATAMVMAGAARTALGDIAERFAAPNLAADVARLRIADLDLSAAIAAVRRSDPAAPLALETWLARSNEWATALAVDEHRSYYDRTILARALISDHEVTNGIVPGPISER
jgi:hypothetical protein